MPQRKKKSGSVPTQSPGSVPAVPFPIVGIGASAGGLAAFEAFFSGMPADREPGMAFVLVQHLAPDHKSLLSDLISRYTRMRVFEVEDDMVVQENCAYIIPPGCDMAFMNGCLQLLAPGSPRGQRLPIDFFFRSLAQDQRERAICIVLSGTGSDGTQGLRAVKAEGGMVMVQTPESTEYDGMPRSAINTGLVDFVVPAAEMPAKLLAYAARAFRAIAPVQATIPSFDDIAKKIHVLLRAQTGHDFSGYKPNTIRRRIERRMAVQQIGDPGYYLRFLQSSPAEAEALFRDLLIGVTSFFRDRDAFAELETRCIPRLFAEKPAGTTIRVWICACSTGEEAYSIAIMFYEHLMALQTNLKLQIFATDIDSRAIEQARSGRYSASNIADVSEERLARFFTLEPDGIAWRINKPIRDSMVFSEQDLIKDPPFSKIDLISCRNLLIYLESDVQKRLIPLFHYALNPGGMLFLGSSETIGEFSTLFSVVDHHAKLFQRQEDATRDLRLPLGRIMPSLPESPAGQVPLGSVPVPGKASPRETTERLLLERYAPVSILVNEKGLMLYVHGNTGRYLQMSSGEPGLNILKMTREGLKRDMTSALHSAAKSRQTVERPGLRILADDVCYTVNLSVVPVSVPTAMSGELYLFLVILDEKSATDLVPVDGPPEIPIQLETAVPPSDTLKLIAALQQELRTKEEYLKSANEELETSNEELKSSNEEMQSVNEELQSTNEELETSKEELQSVNEELSTVNTELQAKVFDLSRANNDMNNLLAGNGIGTIFVDFQLAIQRFTPAVTQVINLIQSDVGRPVGHIVSNLVGYDRLVADIKAVLDSLIPLEVEVETIEGNWFLLRIRPYRTLENLIEGAVITFFEISEMKQARESLRKANDLLRLAVVVHDAHDAIVLQDLEGRILAWNPSATRMYGWTETEALAKNIHALIPAGQHQSELDKVIQLSKNDIMEPYRTQRIARNGLAIEVWLTATALLDASGQVYAIATTERAGGL